MKTPEQLARETAEKVANDFLKWPLPKSVCPDLCCVDTHYPHQRIGTNLLSYPEVKEMADDIVEPLILAAITEATKPLAYGAGQHELVCADVGCSPDPEAPGPTAHEAVQEVILERDQLRARVAELENDNTQLREERIDLEGMLNPIRDIRASDMCLADSFSRILKTRTELELANDQLRARVAELETYSNEVEAKMIDTPARCSKCQAVFHASTTGKMMNRCTCGGTLVTDKMPESSERLVRLMGETFKQMAPNFDYEKLAEAYIKINGGTTKLAAIDAASKEGGK